MISKVNVNGLTSIKNCLLATVASYFLDSCELKHMLYMYVHMRIHTLTNIILCGKLPLIFNIGDSWIRSIPSFQEDWFTNKIVFCFGQLSTQLIETEMSLAWNSAHKSIIHIADGFLIEFCICNEVMVLDSVEASQLTNKTHLPQW